MITISLRFYLTMLAVVTINTALMLVFAFKYLHLVDLPRPVCLHPMQFTPTQIEPAKPLDGAEVWL